MLAHLTALAAALTFAHPAPDFTLAQARALIVRHETRPQHVTVERCYWLRRRVAGCDLRVTTSQYVATWTDAVKRARPGGPLEVYPGPVVGRPV